MRRWISPTVWYSWLVGSPFSSRHFMPTDRALSILPAAFSFSVRMKHRSRLAASYSKAIW